MNNNIVTWFEIPVKDMERAKTFYANVMQTSFTVNEKEGMNMAIFEHTQPAVSGMLIAGENYEPSQTGVVIYLNGGNDLAVPLQRAIEQGGTVLWEKTAINEGECGYFAQFLDSEGNRVGLYSQA
jgi:predicted enzyme related to lactoylglutathione lyase